MIGWRAAPDSTQWMSSPPQLVEQLLDGPTGPGCLVLCWACHPDEGEVGTDDRLFAVDGGSQAAGVHALLDELAEARPTTIARPLFSRSTLTGVVEATR